MYAAADLVAIPAGVHRLTQRIAIPGGSRGLLRDRLGHATHRCPAACCRGDLHTPHQQRCRSTRRIPPDNSNRTRQLIRQVTPYDSGTELRPRVRLTAEGARRPRLLIGQLRKPRRAGQGSSSSPARLVCTHLSMVIGVGSQIVCRTFATLFVASPCSSHAIGSRLTCTDESVDAPQGRRDVANRAI